MNQEHHYALTIQWTGNTGQGTSSYTSYERSHVVLKEKKSSINLSSDPSFRGDPTRHNPEELLVAALSSCHMLWYLHLCSEAGIVVVDYTDRATGTMAETANGSGHFKGVTLNPSVIVSDASMIDKANALHEEANAFCFIAHSVNFPVYHEPSCRVV